MAENRFIGNALSRPKSMVIVGPTGVGVVAVEITCGARVFNFASWNPTMTNFVELDSDRLDGLQSLAADRLLP